MITKGVWLRERSNYNSSEYRAFYVKTAKEIKTNENIIFCEGDCYEIDEDKETVRKIPKAIFRFPKEKILEIEILKEPELQEVVNKIKNFAMLQELEEENAPHN